MAVLDEAAVAEAEHDLSVEAAGVLEVDVFQRRRVAQLRRLEPARDLAFLAVVPLGVDHQSEPLIEAQGTVLGRAELLLEGLRHSGELHRIHLLEGLFDQHSWLLVAAS